MMNNRENRMETLKANGVNTNKYFSIPEDIKEGDKFEVKVDINGNRIIVKCNDSVMGNIIESGYVRNSKLHRRWIMAQMFRALNYDCRWSSNKGFHGFLKDKGYMYSINMITEEAHVLAELEKRDKSTFEERSVFFTKDVIIKTLEHYMVQLRLYVDNMTSKNCKGIPYKTIKGKDVFVADIPKKIYSPLYGIINGLHAAKSYEEINRILNRFKYHMIKLPHNTEMSADFIDAYKGNGAYYTLKNMVMFHDCNVNGYVGVHGVDYLYNKREEYSGEGWRMMGLLKKVIKDNNFDFDKRMEELNK